MKRATFKRGCVVLLLISAAACGGGNSTTTSPSPTQTPTTTFSLTGTVTGGNVFTATTPTAISGATVSVIDGPNAGKSTTTDASGKYTFTGLQQSGFTVNVSAVGYVSQSRPVTLTSIQTLNFALTQPPATIVLTGRVTDSATSAPISGAIVSINGRYRATTDSVGNYSVTGLLDAGGDYRHYVCFSQRLRKRLPLHPRDVSECSPVSHRADYGRRLEGRDRCAG